MKEDRKKGNPRMSQLRNTKFEVWTGETSAKEVKALAEALNMPVAKFIRRAMMHFVRGGVEFSRVLKNRIYD